MAAQIPYADVLARYDRAQAFGETRSLPEYSQHLNDLFGTDAFSQGMRDGPWTRFSTRADTAIHDITGGAPGDVGAEFGAVFGNAEAGRHIGENLPRMLLQTAPMYLAGPEAGIPATIAAYGGTGALFGAQTYAETGSAKVALVSGTAAAAMPLLGKVGGKLTARMFGGQAVRGELPTLVQDSAGSTIQKRAFNEVLPTTEAQQSTVKLARFFGSQTAMAATQIGSIYTQNHMAGGDQSLVDIATSPEFLLNQLPWTVFDAVHSWNVKMPTAEEIRPQLLTPQTGKKPTTSFVSKTIPTEEQAAQVQAFTTQLQQVAAAGGTPEQLSDATGKLIQSVMNPPEANQAQKEAVTETAQQQSDVPFDVIGRSIKYPSGDHRVLIDSNTNGEQVGDQTGQTFWIRGVQPTVDPTTGRYKFNVRSSQMKLAEKPLTESDFVSKTDPNQSYLPTQIITGQDQLDSIRQTQAAQTAAQSGSSVVDYLNNAAEQARARIIARRGRLQVTIDPLNIAGLADEAIIGASHVANGLKDFGQWSKAMLDDFGDRIKPYLQQLFTKAIQHLTEHEKLFTQVQKNVRLNSADVAALPELGLSQEEAESVVQQTTKNASALLTETNLPPEQKAQFQQTLEAQRVEATQKIQKAVQKAEDAQTQEANARTKTDLNPQTSVDIAKLFKDPVASKVELEKKIADGVFATQAVSETGLQENTPEVDKAMLQLNKQKQKLSELAQIAKQKATEQGNKLIEGFVAVAHLPEHSGADVGNLILKVLKSTATVQHPDFTGQVARVVQKWASGEYGEPPTKEKLAAAFFGKNGVIVNASRPPPRNWGPALRVNGEVKSSKNEQEVRDYFNSNPHLAAEGYDVTPNTRHKGKATEYKTWYIKKRIDAVVSLNQKTGDSETELGDLVKPAEMTPVAARPKVSQLDTLDLAKQTLANNADDFAEEWANQVTPAEDVKQQLAQYVVLAEHLQEKGGDTTMFFQELNTKLKAAGLDQFADREDMQDMRGNVEHWISGLQRDRNQTLGSTVPGDPELARSMGLFNGVKAIAKWIAGQKQFGISSDIIKGLLNSGRFRDDTLVHLPGMPTHTPNEFFMHEGQNVTLPDGREVNIPQQLNIGFYPSQKNLVAYVSKLGHELFHLGEAEFSQRNDAAAREYGKARTTVMKVLQNSPIVPKRVRQAFRTIENEGDFTKMLMSENAQEILGLWTKWKKLAGPGNEQYMTYLYAMQNEHETMASFFNDPRLVAIAEQTQMPKHTGFLGSALNFLSKAFGRLGLGSDQHDNAMSYMLKSFDNYLTSGLLKRTYDGSQYIHDSLIQEGVRPEAVASRMQTADAMFRRPTLDASLTGIQREQQAGILPAMWSKGELHPDLEAALRAGDTAKVKEHTMNLLMEDLPFHADSLRRMSQDVKRTGDLQGFVKDGSVPGSLPPNAEAQLAKTRQVLGAMAEGIKKQALAVDRMNQVNNFDPAVWLGGLVDQLTGIHRSRSAPDEVADAEQVRALIGQERLAGGGMNQLLKNFALTQHVGGIIPAAKPVISSVFDEQGLASNRNTLLNGAWIFDNKGETVSRAILKSNQRVAATPSLAEAVSDIQRFQNRENGMKPVTGKEVGLKQVLQKFKPEDQAAIMQVVESNLNRHHVYIGQMQDVMGNVNMNLTGQIIQSLQSGILPDQARAISRQLYTGVAQLVDPQTSAMGAELLKAVSSQIDPQVYFKALQHAQATSQATSQWIQTLYKNPGYTNEQRMGKDRLVMFDQNGKKADVSGTRAELQKLQQTYAAKGYTVADYIKAGDQTKPNLGMSDDFLNSIDQLDQQRKQVVSQILADQPDLRDRILPLVGSATDARTEIAAASPLPNVKRNFSEGRDSINMIDNSNQFYQRMNNWMRVRATRSRAGLDIMHPEVAGNTELSNFLQQHVDNFLTPDNPIARSINKVLFFYKLALDAGQAILWGTQNLTTGISTLMGETGSVGDAFKYWGSAVKEYAQWKTTKSYSSPEMEALINRASSRGRMGGMTGWANMFDEQHNLLMDANAGKLAKAFSPFKTMAMSPTTFMSQYNDAVGLISAFKLGKDRGMSFDDAYDYAEDAQLRGHFNGGKAQRAVGLFSMKTRAVPQLLGALKSYSLGWFGQMAEQYTKGFGKAPEGLTATQRVGAKKAFLYGLVAQFALAGGLGLPGVGQGLALLSQATGEDYKGMLRQKLADMFDEDQTYGGTMTGLAMRGIGNVGLPFDPSSRAAISVPFIGVDERNGFAVANLGGSAVSSLGDFMSGALGMLHGDARAVDKLLPNFLKRPVSLLQGEGDIRSSGGNLITELSPAERYMMAVGLTPSRVQTVQDISEAVKKANVQAQRSRESSVQEFASQIRKGDVDGARTAINQYLQSNPDVQAKQLVDAVSNRVVAQTYPFDPRESLAPGVSLGGLVSGMPANNSQRLQTKVAVQRSLGVAPSMGLGAKMFKAGQLDQTMNADPTLGLRAARQQAFGNKTTPAPASNFLLNPVLPGADQGGLWWQSQ